MKTIEFNKCNNLKGTVKIGGSKNSCLPILAASMLNRKTILYNVPKITDVDKMIAILRYLGCNVKYKKHKAIIDTENICYKPLTIEMVSELRASYYFIPIMLKLFNKCEIAYPGGCKIGKRPIDLHIKMFIAFGYQVIEKNNLLYIEEKENSSSYLKYEIPRKSVGVSINTILMSLVKEKTIVDNSLIEPEIEGVILFLRKSGFDIKSVDNRIIYNGINFNKRVVRYKIIPDRIEATSYIVLGLLTGRLSIRNVDKSHLKETLKLLVSSGLKIRIGKNNINVDKSSGRAIKVITGVYPMIPTDIQPLLGVAACYLKGISYIEENVFEDRMQIYKDINSFGGICNIIGSRCYVTGACDFSYINAKASDLREGMALVILAIASGGIVDNFELVERGYDDILVKLSKIGVKYKIFAKKDE